MTLILSLLLSLAPPAQVSPVRKAEPSLVLPAETKVYVPVVVKVDGMTPAAKGRVKIIPAPVWREDVSVGFVRFTGPPGVYHVSVLLIDFDAKQYVEAEADARIVGDAPPPPDPPGPGPGPNPPPDPAHPSPFDAPGLRALFIYKADDYARTYSPDQKAAIKGADFRSYLNRVCVDESGLRGYRIYELGVDVSGETDVWKKAAARPAKPDATSPWMIVGNGKAGYEGPMPKNSEDIKLIFKSLGATE